MTPRTFPPSARGPPTGRAKGPCNPLLKKNEINCYFPHTVSGHCFLSLLMAMPLPLCPTTAGTHVLRSTTLGPGQLWAAPFPTGNLLQPSTCRAADTKTEWAAGVPGLKTE